MRIVDQKVGKAVLYVKADARAFGHATENAEYRFVLFHVIIQKEGTNLQGHIDID
jgi:hypothetical protein